MIAVMQAADAGAAKRLRLPRSCPYALCARRTGNNGRAPAAALAKPDVLHRTKPTFYRDARQVGNRFAPGYADRTGRKAMDDFWPLFV